MVVRYEVKKYCVGTKLTRLSQIKNIVKIAHNVASSDKVRTSISHLRVAISANGYTIPNKSTILFDDDLYAA
jgi:hypothetical protein